jgi:hypothetical protein
MYDFKEKGAKEKASDKEICFLFGRKHMNLNNASVDRIPGEISGWAVGMYAAVFLIVQEKARSFPEMDRDGD